MSDCAICQSALGNVEPLVHLACAHGYHGDCLQRYCDSKSMTFLTIPCPVCKRTHGQCAEAAAALEVSSATVAAVDEVEDIPDSLEHTTEAEVDATLSIGMSETSADSIVEVASGSMMPFGPIQIVATQRPLFAQNDVFCSNCGQQVCLVKCRLLSKKAGTWRCDNCHTKITQLYRGFGEWPVKEFAGLPEEEQRTFFKGLSTSTGVDAINKVKELISKTEQHERFYECGGEFLPLGVWRTRGYDEDAIEAKSADDDKQVHPVLGLTYRVRLLKTGNRGLEGITRISTYGSASKRLKMCDVAARLQMDWEPPAAPAAPQVVAPPDEDLAEAEDDDGDDTDDDEDDDSGSSSDSSDASSDRGRKNKKGKKDKRKRKAKADKRKKGKKSKHSSKSKKAKKEAEDKAKVLQEKKEQAATARAEAATSAAAARAVAVAQKAKQTLALQMINKLAGPLSTLATAIAKPETIDLPSFLTDTASSQFRGMQKVEKEAKLVMDDASKMMSVQTLKDVVKLITAAKKTEALMAQMIITMARLQQ